MKKRIVISLLVVLGCWSLGFAAVNPFYEGKAVKKWVEKGPSLVEGQVLLKMKPGFSPAAAAHAVAGRVRRPLGDGSIFLLEVAKGNVPAAVQALKRRAGVAIASPNWIRRLHEEPDDAGYGYKWDLNNKWDEVDDCPVLPLKCVTSLLAGQRCPVPGADIDWQPAYDDLTPEVVFSGPNSVTVAVIDTGIDLFHPDLSGKIGLQKDFIGSCDATSSSYDPVSCSVIPEDPDGNPLEQWDDNGHGTHVAGIALAETNNSKWSAGVGFANRIQVMPLKVCDADGYCPDSALIQAIYFAKDNGAKVINLSLGGSEVDALLEEAIDEAWNAGLVVVASSGNDGAYGISYPARFNNVVAVGSTTWADERAPYSNYGPELDVVAPGGYIYMYIINILDVPWLVDLDDNPFAGVYSILPQYETPISKAMGWIWYHDGGDGGNNDDYYTYEGEGWLDGTSMAAPQVSGLAALLFAVGVEDTIVNGHVNDDIRAIIETTADDLGSDGFDQDYGHGRINVARAVTAVLPPGPENSPPVAENDSLVVVEDSGVNTIEVLLDNDYDPDTDPLTIIEVSQATHGTVINYDNYVTYEPHTDFFGTDSFTYVANDGTANSSPATVTITVDPVNDAPVAVDDSYTTEEDTALVIPASGVLGNDTDVDSVSLTAVQVSPPSHAASFSLNADGSFSYTSYQTFNGIDSFTYVANDGTANSNPATVTITVNPATPTGYSVDLNGVSKVSPKSWTATVIVTVSYAGGAKVDGATVNGLWSNNLADSCITDSNGTCNLSLRKIDLKTTSVEFTVEKVNGEDASGETYISVLKFQ